MRACSTSSDKCTRCVCMRHGPLAPFLTRPGRILCKTRLFCFCLNIDLRRHYEPKHWRMKERRHRRISPLHVCCLLREGENAARIVRTINRDFEAPAASCHLSTLSGLFVQWTPPPLNAFNLSFFSLGLAINASARPSVLEQALLWNVPFPAVYYGGVNLL